MIDISLNPIIRMEMQSAIEKDQNTEALVRELVYLMASNMESYVYEQAFIILRIVKEHGRSSLGSEHMSFIKTHCFKE